MSKTILVLISVIVSSLLTFLLTKQLSSEGRFLPFPGQQSISVIDTKTGDIYIYHTNNVLKFNLLDPRLYSKEKKAK